MGEELPNNQSEKPICCCSVNLYTIPGNIIFPFYLFLFFSRRLAASQGWSLERHTSITHLDLISSNITSRKAKQTRARINIEIYIKPDIRMNDGVSSCRN